MKKHDSLVQTSPHHLSNSEYCLIPLLNGKHYHQFPGRPMFENFVLRNRARSLDVPAHTLPETNIASEDGWLEDYFPIGVPAYFQGLC